MSQYAPIQTSVGGRLSDATVFSQTMGYVAVTTAFFAIGAYLGRGLTGAPSLLLWIASLVVLLVMQASRRSSMAVGLLFLFGTLMGLSSGPTLAYYAGLDPVILYQSAACTALTMAGLGAAGFAIQRDLSGVGRIASWALLGLIVLGIVMIFVHIPGGALIYSVLGMAIFAVLTVVDFQRLRRTQDMAAAPYLAVSIFLDGLNIFMFFLRIFGISGASSRD